MGFTGDGGHFETLAELLADEFTVVTYDRRGNGRSPRPAGWAKTSPQAQADDAAALLAALGLAPAGVYGSSAGASFALCLTIRHPERVRCAVLHEPALVRLFDPARRAARSRRSSSRPWPPAAASSTGAAVSLGGRRRQLGRPPARPSPAHAGHGRNLLRGRAGNLRGISARRCDLGRHRRPGDGAGKHANARRLRAGSRAARRTPGRGGHPHARYAHGPTTTTRASCRPSARSFDSPASSLARPLLLLARPACHASALICAACSDRCETTFYTDGLVGRPRTAAAGGRPPARQRHDGHRGNRPHPSHHAVRHGGQGPSKLTNIGSIGSKRTDPHCGNTACARRSGLWRGSGMA